MRPKKIPRIVKAYLMMLSLTVGFILVGLVVLIPATLGNITLAWAIWGVLVCAGYLLWFLTASKHREKLKEWGVIE